MSRRILSAGKLRRGKSTFNEEPISTCTAPPPTLGTTTRRQQRRAPWGTAGLFLVNTVALLIYHVHTTAALQSDTTSDDVRLAVSTEFPVVSAVDKILFAALVLMAFELLDFVTKNSGKWLHSPEIPVRGKHLDDLRPIDTWFIGFSKANTAPFTYFFFRYCWDHCEMDPSRITITNTLLPIPCLYILFDATYCLLHWCLHFQSVYPFIHKHHHIQKAPSRANVDAVNVHPIEFVLGEYNHLWTVWFWTTAIGAPLHGVGALVFLALGGILAGINHTRYDITIAVPLPWKTSMPPNNTSEKSSSGSSSGNGWTYLTIYDSKAHDVHHRIPQSNYGQYTMFWDFVFGSYRPYNPNDRINPEAQLNPNTGKTIQARSKKQ